MDILHPLLREYSKDDWRGFGVGGLWLFYTLFRENTVLHNVIKFKKRALMDVLWYFLDNSTSKSLIVQIVKQALNPSLLF